MINVKQAIRTAHDYFVDLYKSTDQPLEGLLLEGVDQTPDDQYWLITFGFDVEKPIKFYTIAQMTGDGDDTPLTQRERGLHTVWVRAEDGQPEKMSPISLPQ